jgi:hypothetical protein
MHNLQHNGCPASGMRGEGAIGTTTQASGAIYPEVIVTFPRM